MIYDKIENLKIYQNTHEHFIDVLRFINSEPILKLSDGKYDINDQGAFAIVETYKTKDISDCFIECHRKYIDVQVIIEGIENVGICHKSACIEQPYDEEKDFQKLTGDVEMLTLGAGSFMIFYPEDGHMPKVNYRGTSNIVKKIVFKVIDSNIDTTSRNKTDEELRKFKILTDNANDVHFLVGRDAIFKYVNKAACIVSGYSEEELLSMSVPDIDLLHDQEKFQQLLVLLNKEKIPPFESINRRKDGSTFPVEITATGHEINGEPYMFAALRDISERKAAEEEIKNSLKEKEILLREVHHRTKNNMQVISSLLNLQSAHIEDSKYIDMFNDSQNRIRSMSLVHEKLYRSEDLANIDFSDYIKTLAHGLFAFYEEAGRNIELNIDAEDVTLTIDTAIPCGLIINEILSNCLKYAFPDNKNGKIDISFKTSSIDGEIWYAMSVSDNGVGIPEGLDIRKIKSLGIQLITTLVEHQLQGKLELQRRNGTTYNIRFKDLELTNRI